MERILIVDDCQDYSRTLELLLTQQGYETCCVFDPHGLHDILLEFLPTVVLLDLAMPGMSGFEVVQMLRKKGYRGRVYAVTGITSENTRQQAQAAGFDGYLLKPVELANLLAVLERSTELPNVGD